VKYFAIKNWESTQHYAKRNPPWIRLYKNFMADGEIAGLPDSAKFHLVGLWCLAAEYDNRIPCDSVLLKRRLCASSNVNLNTLFELGLIIHIDSDENASTMKADCYTRAVQISTDNTEQNVNNGNEKSNFTILDLQYAKTMRGDILDYKPDYYFNQSAESWAADFCFLRRARKISPHRVLEVWDFARADDFWRGVILAPWNLKRHFDKLEIAMNPPEAAPDYWDKVKQDYQEEDEQ